MMLEFGGFFSLIFDWFISGLDVQFVAQGFEKLLGFVLDFFA